jgi:hypothetical protein
MRKDLQTAQSFIERMDSPDTFAQVCLSTWVAAENHLPPGADHTAMYQYVREQS